MGTFSSPQSLDDSRYWVGIAIFFFSLWCLWWCLHLEQLATELTPSGPRAQLQRFAVGDARCCFKPQQKGNSWKLRLSLAIPLLNPRCYWSAYSFLFYIFLCRRRRKAKRFFYQRLRSQLLIKSTGCPSKFGELSLPWQVRLRITYYCIAVVIFQTFLDTLYSR